jgi:hypothetical protein
MRKYGSRSRFGAAAAARLRPFGGHDIVAIYPAPVVIHQAQEMLTGGIAAFGGADVELTAAW